MAESKSSDGSSTSDSCGGSESALQLNIKTLDSQIYRFRVDTNMFVSALKEKIAAQSGVPVGQQRLIFRGKLLKDDHLISEYNLENEDTLHLVERQPQPSPGISSGDATSSNGNGGTTAQDPAGELLQRIGPIAQSIVMGALNVGDPNEAAVPDLSRVIGAVMNTFGISNPTGGLQPGPPASHGNAAEELQGDGGSENQSIQWQAFHGPSSSHAMQPPLGAAVSFPSSNVAVPDSLSTLVEFLNQMELVFTRNGNQHSSSSIPSNATTVLPLNSRGLPTVEGLSIVLQQAQRLLGEHAVPAISRTSVRLNREGGSNDPAVRGQVQTESIQLGMALQHLGALFLELGRALLTLHMGQSPADSYVNAGPAVYVSPSGPNPIMVQPFPLQTASLFGGSSGVSTSPVATTPLSRNVSIHIHAPAASAVGNRDSSGEGMHGQPVTAAADLSRAHDSAGVNSTEAAARSQPSFVSSAEIDSRNRSLTNHQGQNHAQSSGWSDGLTSLGSLGSCGAGDRHVKPSIASDDSPGGSLDIPIGLGVGSSLQPKRRGKQTRAKPEGASSSSDSRVGLRQQTMRHGENDMAEAMSELLQGPALDGLLAGVSQQTGVGSPDMLRNMLQQFAENPAMRSAVDQIAQQVDDRDIGSMLSGLDGDGGGIDFSRMMQQMMPVVSRALGGGAASDSASSSRRGMTGDPQDVFQSLVDGAVNLLGDGGAVEDLVNELPGEGGLAQEFMEMLQRDVSRRFRDEAGS